MKRALPLILMLLIAPVWAQDKTPRDTDQKKLDALNAEIENRKNRQATLKAAAAQLREQQKALQRRTIALARDLQNIDAERDRLEDRLAELAVTENQFDEALQNDRAALARLLAGLQAMQKQPAPAFAVHAEDALSAVQGAVVMAAVVPGMQERADELRDRLTELAALRTRMDRQSEALITAEQDAATARADLDKALRDKAAAEKKTRLAAAREAEAIARLVAEARDLRDLSRRLETRTAGRFKGSAFGDARGLLPLPVTGQVVAGFGQRNENGVRQQGLSISGRPGAQINAPYDGLVLYSGPFRQYGEIVIISLADGFQMILAGLADSGVYVGQEILAGEPVGVLSGTQSHENHHLGSSTSGRSQLYMELRFDGRPIDPSPWLKAENETG
ncbi:MAG: peptidoglycan DD-metalloendopeptidase family protein [Alphaproteobacteria bacterium]|nr:peptidoglycan DD-metalloendopeptidase family protein [Alphaproteobacteria bacterium]